MVAGKTFAFFWLTVALLLAGCSQEISFKKDIFPIFEKRCLSCHKAGGMGYEKSGFSVESYAAILKGTRHGRVVDPGSSINSTLFRLVDHQVEPQIFMPFEAPKLPEEEIKVIREWIDHGAKDN